MSILVGNRRALLAGRAPGWVPTASGVPASLAFDFANQRAWRTKSQVTPDSILTVTRASAGYRVNSAGVYESIASNLLRYTYDYTTLASLGVLVEEARTNSCANSSALTGTVAGDIGSGGAYPNNWSSGATAVTQTIVGTGVENGVEYVDVRFHGVPSVTTAQTVNGSANITTTLGLTWSIAMFLKLVAGDLTNVNATASSFTLRCGNEAGSTDLRAGGIATNGLTRYLNNRTMATSTSANCTVRWNYIDTITAVDFTLRFGWPQLEANGGNAVASSVAVAAGGVSYVNGDTITLGGTATGTATILTVTNAVAGIIQAGGVSITNAGSYTASPVNPVPQGSTSGIGSGATFTVTWTDNSSKAFSTSPIRTTTAAVARSADAISMTLPTALQSLLGIGIPNAPTAFGTNQRLADISDNSNNNRVTLSRATATGVITDTVVVGNVSQYSAGSATWAINTRAKTALASQASDQNSAYNGTLQGGTSGTHPAGIVKLAVGARHDGALLWNGTIESLALWPFRVSNAELQRLTT